jgi:hypothetical protein
MHRKRVHAHRELQCARPNQGGVLRETQARCQRSIFPAKKRAIFGATHKTAARVTVLSELREHEGCLIQPNFSFLGQAYAAAFGARNFI